jgi:hypothetical protein
MGMPFFKAYSEGVLRGSLASTDDSTQLIWFKLIAMANETRDRDGYLRFAPGKPYNKEYIIQALNTTQEKYDNAIKEFLGDVRNGHARIEVLDDGTIFLTNFMQYQSKPIKLIQEEEAKNQAISANQRIRESREATTVKLTQAVESLDRKIRHIPTVDGDAVDTITGEKIGGDNG